jgi:hypothetical protein
MSMRVLLLATGLIPAIANAAPRFAPCRSAQFTIDGNAVGSGAITSQTVELGALAGLGDVCPLVARSSAARRRTA